MTRGGRLSRGAGVLAAALLFATPAHAHGNTSLGDFYQGLLQPFFHPEFLFPLLAAALWSTQQEDRAALAACASLALAVAAGATAALLGLAPAAPAWGPRLSMLVLGPLVAARVRPPLAACAALVAIAGFAQGHAATAGELAQIQRPELWVPGLAAGAALLGAYANAATRRFRAFWLEVGVRVAGSWIAAIGLLVCAMALRSR